MCVYTCIYMCVYVYIYIHVIFMLYPGKGDGYPEKYSGLKNPMNKGVWWATVHESQRVRHN